MVNLENIFFYFLQVCSNLFDMVNLENIIFFFIFLKVWSFLIGKQLYYKTNDDVIKVHSLVERLTLRLIKSELP